MSEAHKAKIEDLIKKKKVVVFSKTYCPFCKKAKNALSNYNIPQEDYYVWELDKDPECDVLQATLKEMTGASSVPRVFINGKFIGGGDDTVRLHENGQLATLLA